MQLEGLTDAQYWAAYERRDRWREYLHDKAVADVLELLRVRAELDPKASWESRQRALYKLGRECVREVEEDWTLRFWRERSTILDRACKALLKERGL